MKLGLAYNQHGSEPDIFGKRIEHKFDFKAYLFDLLCIPRMGYALTCSLSSLFSICVSCPFVAAAVIRIYFCICFCPWRIYPPRTMG